MGTPTTRRTLMSDDYKATKWLTGLLVVLMVAFIAGVGWACWSGSTAKEAAGKVRHDLDVYEAKQEGTVVMIQDSLDRIEDKLKKQQEMIEDLWKKNGGK